MRAVVAAPGTEVLSEHPPATVAGMRAAVGTQYGGPEVVEVQEVAVPTAGPGEVLVKIRWSTVNRTDCGYRAAHPFFIRAFSGWRRPKATVLGTEFAGEVVALGAGVARFAVGDRVFGYREPEFGCHAEYLTAGEDGPIAVVPAGVTDEQAAASTEASHYALAIIDKGGVEPGQRVLVYGASGGIGSAAVQLLKARGVHVTAVCGPEAVDLMRDLGADRVIDRTVQDFTADGEQYDVVIDAVGKSSLAMCRPVLRPGGAFLTTDLGKGWQNLLLQLATKFGRGRRVMMPTPSTVDRALIEHFQSLLGSGDFRPLLDERRFDLEQIVEALRYVESQRKIGNVVLRVAPAQADW